MRVESDSCDVIECHVIRELSRYGGDDASHDTEYADEVLNRNVSFGPKWEKYGTFSDQISVRYGYGAGRKNVLKSDLKKSRIFPIWDQV